MSKNVKLNSTEYNGVSTVQLPTTDGGTATFKDTDEIVTPSGSTTITENGTFDVAEFAKAIVNVAASGGSGGTHGTFTGDGTNKISLTLPESATVLIVYSDTLATQLNNFEFGKYGNYKFLCGVWMKDMCRFNASTNYADSGFQATFYPEGHNDYAEASWDDLGNFADNKLIAGAASPTIEGEIYHWVAY